MSEHAEYIAKLVAGFRPLTEAEKADLKVLLAPGVAAVAAEKRDEARRNRPVRRAA
jgi:hypothetical protein